MIDEFAIQQTLNRYTQAAGRADWDHVMATFMPDGIWDVPAIGAHLQGHAAIRAAMEAFIGQMAYYVQINSPAIITVEGDMAKAQSAIHECGKYADRDEALEVLGFYKDELVRTTEGWKFARRTFQGAGMHTYALQPAPAA